MADYILPLQRLIEQFRSLPGIGGKTAQRLAFAVLDFTDEQTQAFAEALLDAKRSIHECARCHNICEAEFCSICEDESRDTGSICVVEDVRSIMSFERIREYRGVYHVLGGTISPLDGRGPEQLHIADLIERVEAGGVREVIIATGSDVEGETTAMFLTRRLKQSGVRISRLAYGIPVGSDLEYADAQTLTRAFEGRRDAET
jgi:recombination protein RecR